MTDVKDVVSVAVRSRLYLLIIQYIGNLLIPDHKADAFVYPGIGNFTFADKAVHHFLGGLKRWDAQYFIHIAKYGYTYENTVAFFPLYPATMRLIGTILTYILPLNLDSSLILASVSLNIVIFIFSAKVLYKISYVLFNKRVAYKSAFLFCYNPASVFFIAPYSECLFSYLTFESILSCFNLFRSRYDQILKFSNITYLLPIMLSTIVRSNGLLNIGFLMYTYLCIIIKHYSTTNSKLKYIIKHFICMIVLTLICLFPFWLYQLYCYKLFCSDYDIVLPKPIIDYATENDLVLPGNFSKYNHSWCHHKLPLAYSYVQDHYWNVGLLRYYHFKQIPNFLLAAPILYILLKNCLIHIWHCGKKIINIFSFKYLMVKTPNDDIYSLKLNVFVIHAIFLSLFCILFVHIQVSTRMLCSATPLFYWYCVQELKDEKSLVKYYFASYFLVGTVLFCNFLPWT